MQDISFQATIKITGNDKLGLMNEISQVISNELKVNMQSLKIQATNGAFMGTIKIIVKSTKQLTELLKRISRIPGIDKAVRID